MIETYELLELKQTNIYSEDNVSGMFTENRTEFIKMINEVKNRKY